MSIAGELALATGVASGLASDVRAALDDALGKGPGGADAVSLLRLLGSSSELDVWTGAASAVAKADADKKKAIVS